MEFDVFRGYVAISAWDYEGLCFLNHSAVCITHVYDCLFSLMCRDLFL
jgi:hypothetical protein